MDKLFRDDSAVEDLDAPLDIVRYEGKLYSLRNRRATVPPRNHKDMFMMQSFKVGPPMSSKHTPPKLIPMALGKLCTRTRSPQTALQRLRVLAITAVTPRSSVARHREALSLSLSLYLCQVLPQRPTKATEASNKRKASPNKSSSHAEEGILTIESEDASSENDSVKSMKVPWTKRGEAKSHAMLNRALQKKEKTSTKVAEACKVSLQSGRSPYARQA